MNTLLAIILIFNQQQDTPKIKTRQLEQIVIESVRGDKSIPISETTIKAKQIVYVGQELPAIISSTPSITWYSDGGNYNGYSYYRLRGIDQTRINVTLNGIPLNEPEDQGAYFTNYPDFFNNLRSVQIQRGVGVSTNGVSSFAGSINFESPSLRDSTATQVQLNYGSFNTSRLSAKYNSGIRNGFGFYSRVSKLKSDGFRDHSGTNGESVFFSGGYFGKRNILKFTGFAGGSRNEMAYLAVAESDLKKNYKTNYLRPDEKDNFKQAMVSLEYSLNINDKSYLTATAYYNKLSGNYDVFFDPDMFNFALTSDWKGVFVNFHRDFNKLKIVTGVHFNDYNRNHFLRLKPDLNSNLYYNTGHKTESSGFVRTTYDINKLSIYSDIQVRSARFNYISDKATDKIQFIPIGWQFLNPKIGLSYLLNNKKFYTSAGITHREPTRNDMLAGYDNIDYLNFTEIGSLSKVKPEQVLDIETGLETIIGKLNLATNLYWMKFKNEIAAIGQLSYIGLPLRKNVPSSQRMGIEVDLKYHPLKNLLFTSSANISRNRIDHYVTEYDNRSYSNVTPLLTPSVIINHSAQYEFKNITTRLSGRYVSQSFLDNTNNKNFIIPQSYIINTSVNIRINPYLTFGMLINNVLNKKYYNAGYIFNNQSNYFAMATRNYMLSLTGTF